MFYLALLHAASGLVNTYPVKSTNLATAQSTDGAFEFFKAFGGDGLNLARNLDDIASGYGVATSDGGFVLAGAGLEGEGATKSEAFAIKLSATGTLLWSWSSSNLNQDDAAVGCTQLPTAATSSWSEDVRSAASTRAA